MSSFRFGLGKVHLARLSQPPSPPPPVEGEEGGSGEGEGEKEEESGPEIDLTQWNYR